MIYLDHAAATPVNPKVLAAMEPYFSHDFFNPSSAYLPAKKVAADYEAAKATIAHTIGAKSNDVVITAGATEANNLAFTCVKDGQKALCLCTEHDSVRNITRRLNHDFIGVDQNGRIDLNDFKSKLTDDVVLVSISLVNNELGVIQPLADVAGIIREAKLDRLKRGIKTPIFLHSDASQALNLLDISVARLGVDLLTLNAAKVYGPKAVGALYVSHDVKLSPITYGGGQENGLRSGTENVPGVIGFAKAVSLAKEHLNGNRKKYAGLKKILLTELENYKLINKKHTLDNFVVVCYEGLDAERLIYLLEDKEIYVSTGAACAASKGEKSHVLAAIGLNDAVIAGSLRISLGETNDEAQIHTAAKIINDIVKNEYERIRNE